MFCDLNDCKQEMKTDHIIEPEFVRIPAGYFWMGSEGSDMDAYSNEKPIHTVCIYLNTGSAVLR